MKTINVMEFIIKRSEEVILEYIREEAYFICTLFNYEQTCIYFDDIEEHGKFIINTGEIILSRKLLDLPYEALMETLLHELRHFYQLNQILDNVNKPIVKKWTKELISNSNDRSANLEIDAIAFAQVMLRYVYDCIPTKRDDKIQHLVNDHLREINVLEF